MISVQDLSKKYGPVMALSQVSFEVAPREVVGFLGPNGAGKSTTLRILSGYLPPSSGKVLIHGRDTAEQLLQSKADIGYLPENNPLYEEMEVVEYLRFLADVRSLQTDRKNRRIKEVLEICGLGKVIGRDIGELSKGYRQRVGLASAILHDPIILLLDEPTSGLDPNQTHELRQLIQELKKEKTVLLSTHILSEVQSSCDRVIIVHLGKIVAQGTSQELKTMVSGGNRFYVKLRATETEARETLEKFEGVASVKVKDSEDGASGFEITADPGTDLREKIFRTAVEKNWVLLELKRETASLEEVFRELTT